MPSDEHFAYQLKHKVVDFDFIKVPLPDNVPLSKDPNRTLLLVGEKNQVTAYVLEGKSRLAQVTLPLVGKTLVSVSVSAPKNAKQGSFLVAIGLFD